MSLFRRLFRRAVFATSAALGASVALATYSAMAQELPAPAPLNTAVPSAPPLALTPQFAPPAVYNQPGGPTQGPVVPAAGSHFGKRGTTAAPCLPCPPATTPAVPPTTPGMMPPPPGMEPQPAPAPAPDFGDRSASAGADVGSVVGLSAPNLFGDLFGGQATQVFIQRSQPGFLNGKTVVVAVTNVSRVGQGGGGFGGGGFGGTSGQGGGMGGFGGGCMGMVSGNLSNGSFSIRDATAANLVPVPSIRVMGIPVSNPINLSTVGVRGSFTETVPVGPNTVYTPSGTNAATANYVLQYLAGTSNNPAGSAITIPAVVPFGAGRDMLAVPVEQAQNPQAKITQFSLSPVQAVFTGSELRYFSTISDTIMLPSIVLSVPNPGSGGGGGGVVGLIKISEDNNPMPRDRFIFNYDYFEAVPFTPAGIPVNRYQFGFEKTFFDGRTSLEFRLPFANTFNSDSVMGASGTNTEFGNVRLTAKALLLRRQTVNISTGMAVFLPTSDDLNIRGANGRSLIHVDNSSVQLSPFAAILWTPNDRWFAQAWVAGTFDTGGNRVTVDPMVFGGAANIGNLRGANLLTADLQVGYWIYQSDNGILRGLAPFAEIHYNGAVSDGSVLSAGNGFFIGDTGGNFDEVNLTFGATARMGQNANLSVGVATPVRGGNDRSFDYQIGVRFNYFFGYTARQQNRGTFASTFGG